MASVVSLDMVMRLDAAQPTFVIPSVADIPEDNPVAGPALEQIGPFGLPSLVFGAGAFSNQYNEDDHLVSDVPLRTVRLALRYGIRAFDTSAYYGPSEIVLGNALKALEEEFPRSSYSLMTKCGRYGLSKKDFDYSPSTIRRSVERSLERFHTPYLDVVYLHDVEFVATALTHPETGDHTAALGADAAAYGLEDGQEATVWGEGDQKVLDAIAELQAMQAEGLIKHIGMTGYPLPTLFRLALLVLHTQPYKPLDILLSYSHSNLQNTAFFAFAPHFRKRARITQLLAASPLSMGLLTSTPPSWHPAPPALRAAVARAVDACTAWPGGLPNIALGYSMRASTSEAKLARSVDSNGLSNGTTAKLGEAIPIVVGFSIPEEVHEAVKVWRDVQSGRNLVQRREIENIVLDLFRGAGLYNWSWASPGEDK